MLRRRLRKLRATRTDYNHHMSMLEIAPDIESAIGDMVEIIARGWDPLQIVLFGSRGRGDGHEYSDVDLLVVLDDCNDRSRTRHDIREALLPLRVPTDIVVTTPALLIKRACLVGAVERKAVLDGRILYVRGGGDPVTEAALHQLHLATEDLGTADLLLSSESQPPRQACFHARQAAEKALKAALELEHNDYPHIHQLEELLQALPLTWPLHELDVDLVRLSRLVIFARYPDADNLPSRADAVKAVADARLVVESVIEEFQRRGLELS